MLGHYLKEMLLGVEHLNKLSRADSDDYLFQAYQAQAFIFIAKQTVGVK